MKLIKRDGVGRLVHIVVRRCLAMSRLQVAAMMTIFANLFQDTETTIKESCTDAGKVLHI